MVYTWASSRLHSGTKFNIQSSEGVEVVGGVQPDAEAVADTEGAVACSAPDLSATSGVSSRAALAIAESSNFRSALPGSKALFS